jgi:hypothetical protein
MMQILLKIMSSNEKKKTGRNLTSFFFSFLFLFSESIHISFIFNLEIVALKGFEDSRSYSRKSSFGRNLEAV